VPNTLLTAQVITNELLLRFKNSLGFSGAIAHTWDDKFAVEGAKIGDTLRLRDAARFTVAKGRVITPQDVIEGSKTLTLNQQANVSFQFSSAELTLTIDAFRDRYLDSAAVALANQVDVDGLLMAYQSTANAIGTPGSPLTMLDAAWQAGEVLDLNSTPMDGRRTMVISPKVQTLTLKAAQGLFQSSTQVKNQYERGRMGTMGGFEWVMDQNTPVHTVGPLGGAPQVGAASQIGSTLNVTGFTAAAALRLKKGDLFTLPTVFGTNPVSGAIGRPPEVRGHGRHLERCCGPRQYPDLPADRCQWRDQDGEQLAGRGRAAHDHRHGQPAHGAVDRVSRKRLRHRHGAPGDAQRHPFRRVPDGSGQRCVDPYGIGLRHHE